MSTRIGKSDIRSQVENVRSDSDLQQLGYTCIGDAERWNNAWIRQAPIYRKSRLDPDNYAIFFKEEDTLIFLNWLRIEDVAIIIGREILKV